MLALGDEAATREDLVNVPALTTSGPKFFPLDEQIQPRAVVRGRSLSVVCAYSGMSSYRCRNKVLPQAQK
jgi:hypothetical protein